MDKSKNDEKAKNDNLKSVRLWTWKRFGIVTGMALLYGLVAVAASVYPNRYDGAIETVYLSFLIGVPVAIGALSIYTIPPPLRTFGRIYSMSITTTLLFALVACVYAPFILICVLMATPLILVASLISSLIMWQIDKFNRRHDKQYQYGFAFFVLIFPYILAPIESNIDPATWERQVVNEVIIYNTTPAEVWENILNVPTITSDEQRITWYQALGIPRPVEAVVEGEGVGAIRTGTFEHGLTFHEEVTVWETNRAIEFNVNVLVNPQSTPVLQQIGGAYFDVLSAGYEIGVIDETTVRLTLRSDYRLSTNFNFYGIFWSDWIMQDFQSYVLQTIKTRIES